MTPEAVSQDGRSVVARDATWNLEHPQARTGRKQRSIPTMTLDPDKTLINRCFTPVYEDDGQANSGPEEGSAKKTAGQTEVDTLSLRRSATKKRRPQCSSQNSTIMCWRVVSGGVAAVIDSISNVTYNMTRHIHVR